MTPNDVKLALHEVLGSGVFLNTSTFVIFVSGWLVATALAAGVGSFFGKRGETAAVKRDLTTIKENLRQTTAVTAAIQADIAGGLWVEQSRWTFKAGFYKELLESSGILASSLTQLAVVEQQRHMVTGDATRVQLLDHIEKDYDERAVSAFSQLIKCEAVARAWLSAEALDALDKFASDWREAWVGPRIVGDRTQRMHAAAVGLHALLCRVVQDDLQLRRMA